MRLPKGHGHAKAVGYVGVSNKVVELWLPRVILLDDALRYAERATDQGVDVTLGIWAGMPHTFPGLIGKLAAATEAVSAECNFLNTLLDAAG